MGHREGQIMAAVQKLVQAGPRRAPEPRGPTRPRELSCPGTRMSPGSPPASSLLGRSESLRSFSRVSTVAVRPAAEAKGSIV